MRKLGFLWVLSMILSLIPGVMSAQFIPETGNENQMENLADQENQESQHSPGSLTKKIDPQIKLWYLNGFGAFVDSTSLDTLQSLFHNYHPVYKQSMTAGELGNYASPYIDSHFFNRHTNLDFSLLRSREAYLLTPQTIRYFNTRTPYTLLDYSQSENRSRKNETRFNVLHTQNVNPYLNFTFRYDQARSAGQYKNQDSKNHFITLYSSYTRDHLYLHGGFIRNSIFNNENGGLVEGSDLLGEPDTDFLNVNLTTATSEHKSTWFFANGEYRFGKYVRVEESDSDSVWVNEETGEEIYQEAFIPRVGVLYSFDFQNNLKKYADQEGSTNSFFEHAYYGDNFELDSIRFHKVKNIVQLKQYEDPDRKTSFGKRAFLGQEFVRASLPGAAIGLYNQQTKKYSNLYAGGGIFRQSGTFWRWNFEGRIFLLGRDRGETHLSGVISKPLAFRYDSLTLFSVRGGIENRMPDIFQEEYYSHRIRWKRDLKMEQRMTVNGSLTLPSKNFELGANYAIINNYLYNDSLGVPDNYNGQLLILSAHVEKEFILGNFRTKAKILGQKASNSRIIHLPDLSARVSSYYSLVISKVLFTQLGVDVRYDSRYYADAYHPVTGLFYLQDREKVGGFPYLDAYASLRLKRTRVFFKMLNIGTQFIEREYYTVPDYPMNRMTFRLGIAWAFYD